jgi:hypothetical protein
MFRLFCVGIMCLYSAIQVRNKDTFTLVLIILTASGDYEFIIRFSLKHLSFSKEKKIFCLAKGSKSSVKQIEANEVKARSSVVINCSKYTKGSFRTIKGVFLEDRSARHYCCASGIFSFNFSAFSSWVVPIFLLE